MKTPEINNDQAGMTWWNELSEPERETALERATDALHHEASAAEAWELWRTGKIDLKPGAKIIPLDMTAEFEKRETAKAVAAVRAELGRPQTPVPQEELDLLEKVSLGDTGQSRTCRYLLCLLVGAEDPTGFKGEGLLEMRTLDRKLADAYLKVLDWWRGPTKSDAPFYDVLRKLEAAYPTPENTKTP